MMMNSAIAAPFPLQADANAPPLSSLLQDPLLILADFLFYCSLLVAFFFCSLPNAPNAARISASEASDGVMAKPPRQQLKEIR